PSSRTRRAGREPLRRHGTPRRAGTLRLARRGHLPARRLPLHGPRGRIQRPRARRRPDLARGSVGGAGPGKRGRDARRTVQAGTERRDPGDLRALARRRDRRGDPRMAGEGVVSEPVRLTLPWSVLVPVNRRTNPAGWGKMRGRQFLTREYRDAQRTAELLVQSQVRGKRPRFTAPVAMTLRFYEPD